MKAPSVRDCLAVSYLRNLGKLQLRDLHIRFFGGKFRENKTVSLKKPVYNVLLH